MFDAYYLGFESEPAMDAGGQDVGMVHSLISRSMSKVVKTSYVAPA